MDVEENQKSTEAEKLKQIPKWTRKYAQNRTIPFLVAMAIFLLLFLGIAGSSYLTGRAYRSGNMLAFWICIFVQIPIFAALLFFCVPKWGGKLIERTSQQLYGKEGVISMAAAERMKTRRWVGYIAGLAFAFCVVGSVQLGIHGYIPIEYMQPVSALYCVPFLVFLGIWQRPAVGPGFLSFLWPILYAVHAILVVAGVPIQFDRPWIMLNMLIPVAGYGILCGLIGHIYSRYALRKLKKLTHLDEGSNDGT